MQVGYKDGSVLIAGICIRDADFKTVGAKQSRLCETAVRVGTCADPENPGKSTGILCNVKAWHDLASILATAKKGDSVCVIGKIDVREYNGKTYKDLVADWLNVASVSAAAQVPTAPTAEFSPVEPEVDIGPESELPF